MERIRDLCYGRGNSSLDKRTSNVLGVHENTDLDSVLVSFASLKRHGEYFFVDLHLSSSVLGLYLMFRC